MANNIQLDEGASGKYTETDEVTAGIHRQVMEVGSVAACKLKYGAVSWCQNLHQPQYELRICCECTGWNKVCIHLLREYL